MMDKAVMRLEARAARRAVDPTLRAQKSDRIADHVLALPLVARAQAVGCYASMGSEVDTTRILRELLARNVRVAVPVEQGQALRFVRLQHPWALAPGPRGVPIPRQPWEDVGGDELDVVIVPGLRFGRDGSRLGQGGGHFDRFLQAHPRPKRVGVAFTEQVVDRIEVEAHDQGMDVLVTDEGVATFLQPR